MSNVLPREKKIEVLHHLVEGNTLRSTSRLTGVHRTTIMKLMVEFGTACADYMDATMRNLDLKHVECDEIWTFVQKKQARLTIDEKAERHDIGDVYLWTAIDAETKLVAAYVIGKRSADNARKLMMSLKSRMRPIPKPHATDAHHFRTGQPFYLTQVSTDGFPGYPEAVDLAFGPYAKYGTIIKEYRNDGMQYDPSEMVGTRRTDIRGVGEDLHSICTSHVERHNLTIRTLMKRFTRLSLGFSKKLENLEAAVAMFLAYYNYVWRTRLPEKSGQCRVPAAMAAGVVKSLWSFENLFDEVTAA
jgi:IS1 family transposase